MARLGSAAMSTRGDKIATCIFRGIIFCLGVLLLFAFIKMWNKIGIRGCMMFCAMIGLFMGYGIGGDIWGARFFDLFTGQNSQAQVGNKYDRLSKVLLFVLLGVLLAILALFVFVLYLPHRA